MHSRCPLVDLVLTAHRVTRKITHLVTSNSRARTTKVKQAAQRGNIKIVNQQWLVDSMSRWERQNEEDYLVSISIPMEI